MSVTSPEHYVDSIMSHLQNFRRLPTYQLERRIDALLLPFLESITNDKFPAEGSYVLVYAEFPLGTDSEKGLYACYADYMFYNKQTKHILFAELKTDCTSVSEEQFKAYCAACGKKWNEHLDFFVRKAKVEGEYQKKFAYGLHYLNQQTKELVGCEGYAPTEEMLAPLTRGLNKHLEEKTFTPIEGVTMSFVYIAPEKARVQLEDLKQRQLALGNTGAAAYKGLIPLSSLENYLPIKLFELLKSV